MVVSFKFSDLQPQHALIKYVIQAAYRLEVFVERRLHKYCLHRNCTAIKLCKRHENGYSYNSGVAHRSQRPTTSERPVSESVPYIRKDVSYLGYTVTLEQ